MELLRFVTAYRTGLEAMVDATPYAPLLSMADLAGNVGFYAFIDTWVSNATGHDAMCMNNVTHQCSPMRHTYGKGWALSLDLVVWPQEPTAMDTRPRSSITLASGVFGSTYPIGVVNVHEGALAGNGANVVLDHDADFSEAADALPVYACAGGAADIRRAGLLGFVAQDALQRSRKRTSRHSDDADSKEKDKSYAETLLEYVASPELVQLEVVKVFEENRTVHARYSSGAATVEHGMPLYFASADVYIDTHLKGPRWKNLTYPFEPVGHVIEVGSQGTLTGQLRHPCLPTAGRAATADGAQDGERDPHSRGAPRARGGVRGSAGAAATCAPLPRRLAAPSGAAKVSHQGCARRSTRAEGPELASWSTRGTAISWRVASTFRSWPRASAC